MSRRGNASVVANPVLVGAVTALVSLVAVFLAYNANNGLPFVPTRALDVQVDNGAELVPGDEVRSGGYRVGVVEDMDPVKLPNGRVGALLHLKLDQKFGAVPADSQVVVRPRSTLGLKYVELVRGRARRTIRSGGTLPLAQTKIPVELDEFNNMFDKRTRQAARDNLYGFGNAFVGRGYDLNQTIAAAPRFFRGLRDVMANLSDPRTELRSFFKELGDAARIIAPVSQVNARVFSEMATTFEAFSRDPQALKDTIAKNVPTLRVATESLRVQRPFLAETAAFSHDLRFAAQDLKAALPPLNEALAVGAPVQRRSIALNNELQDTMNALNDLSSAPTTKGSLVGLTDTVGTLQPQLRFLGPYVTVCNYWTMFWYFTADQFTAPDATGGAQRALLNNGSSQDDGVTSMGANEFVHGVGVNPNDPTHAPVPQFVHNNTTGGDAVHPDGRANCQKGQQGYAYGLNRFRPGGYDAYRRDVVDQPQPDDNVDFGPAYGTFDRSTENNQVSTITRVPKGETFTVAPGGTAEQLPKGGLPNLVLPPYNPYTGSEARSASNRAEPAKGRSR